MRNNIHEPTNHLAFASTPDPEWESEDAIARRFSVSVFLIRKLRYAGKIRAATVNGRMVRIKVEDARAFFEASASGGDAGKTPPAKGFCGVWRAKRAPRPVNLAKHRHPSPLSPNDGTPPEQPDRA
jgi:hypothetical protein